MIRQLALLPISLAALAGCSGAPGDVDQGGDPIYCALGGSSDFKPACRVERTEIDGAQVLIVRHPDGGFRRLAVSSDGLHLEAADGADASQSALKGDRFEVILGNDRYVIPAKGHADK